MKAVGGLVLSLAFTVVGAGSAGALPLTLLFERRVDTVGGSELATVEFMSLQAAIDDVGAVSRFSQIDVDPGYDSTGLTWDGSQYVMMFERTVDTVGGSELAFVLFPTREAILNDIGAVTRFSQIDVDGAFNSTGLAWDGARFVMMFERTADTVGGSELAFVTFPSLDAMVNDSGGVSRFSSIDVASGFDSTGLTWDGSQFVIMFQRTVDTVGGSELAFVTFPSLDAMVNDTGAVSRFSVIDVDSGFRSTGLDSATPASPDGGGATVPLPASALLLCAAVAALGARRRTRGPVRSAEDAAR